MPRRGVVGAGTVLMVALAGGPASAAPPAAAEISGPAALTVTAVRPTAQTLLDRKVYAVTGDLRSTSGTAADILNQVPSVEVDPDGVVSLRGDTSVTILVDGKPSAQFSGPTSGLSLLQFPAADIDRIEVMTNPPAQYKAEGSAGVINIITKKTRKAGFSGTANASLGDKRRFVTGLNVNYNTGRLKLSAGVSLRQEARVRLSTSDRAAVDPATGTTVLSHQMIDEHFLRHIPQVKLGAEYTLNDRQSLNLDWSHRELSGNRFFTQDDQSQGVTGPLTSLSSRHSDGHEWSVDNGQSVRFDQKLWRPDETFSLTVQRSATRERERYAYNNIYSIPETLPTQDRLRLSLDIVTTEASADYVLPLSADRSLKLGYDFEDDNNRFDNLGDDVDPVTGRLIENPNVTNHFRYRQQIHTVYGQYETPIGPWTLQSGLRLEQTNVHTLQITGDVAGAYGYFRAYPSLNMDWRLSDQAKLSLGLSRRVTRPDPEALNPFTDYQDIHNLRAGNANLLPQDTWSYELGFNGAAKNLSYGLTGYYRFNRDSVTDVTRVVSADVVLVTKANLPKSKAAGVEFTASGKIIPQLALSVSGNLFHNQIDASALGLGGLRSTTGLNVKASLDYKPTPVDTLQISFSRSDRRLTPQGYIDAINLVNLGFRRQISSKLAALITVSDAFDGQRFRRVVETPTLRDVTTRYQIGRVAYVGVVYSFGAPKKAKPGGFEYDQ